MSKKETQAGVPAAVSSAPGTNKITTIDVRRFLPEGMGQEDLHHVGGFRPIATAELTQDNPVAGWIVGCLDMPERPSLDTAKRKQGITEPWQALLIELTHATKGKVGDDIVDVEAGKEVIVAINGNLGNNRDVLLAASDTTKVFWGLFIVTGQIELGGGRNPMWNYEVQLHKKFKAREGRYALVASPKAAPVLPQRTSNAHPGDVVDRDGRTVQSLV